MGDHRRAVACRMGILVHAEPSGIHGVELCVAVPGFVVVDGVHGLSPQFFGMDCIVTDTVVS